MFYLLKYWRLGLLAAALALYPMSYIKGRYDGARKVEDQHAVDKARANSEARQIENLRQSRVDEAVVLAAARQGRITADASNARAQRDGVRDDRDAIRLHAAQSIAAATLTVAAYENVFGQCVRAYSDLAEVADRHAADALTLREAWPK